MTDHPMPFSAPMVRALLEGRKTQTRRVVEPIYTMPRKFISDLWQAANGGPYFKLKARAGDRLWSRESLKRGANNEVVYAADGHVHPDAEWVWQRNTLPSIYMPRGLSRLTLIIEDVRVERLQDISEADAIAEGVLTGTWASVVPMLEDPANAENHTPETPIYSAPDDDSDWSVCMTAKGAYRRLWNMIHDGDPDGNAWDLNPWVVPYSFNVIRDNINRIKP